MASWPRGRREAPRALARFATAVWIAACLVLLSAGFVDRARACSQCMCGTPFPAGVLGGVVPMQVTYGLEERYLSKTSGLDEGPGEEQERENRVAGFTSQAWNGVQLLAQVNGRWAARDRLEDGAVGENTGGLVTYAAPGMRWLIGSGLGLEESIQVPVGQRLYGDQKEHTTGRISLAMRG